MKPQAPWYAPPKNAAQARRQAFKETRPEYLPVKRQLHNELRASHQRERQVGNWWNEYVQKVAANQQQTQAAYAAAAQQAQGLINTASTADNANTQRLSEQAQQSAATRGMEAPAQPQQTAAASQAIRNYLSANVASGNAQRGANQFAYLGEQERIGTGQGIKSRMDEQGRGRKISEDLLAAKKEQGGQAVKNFQAKRSEANELALKRQAFGLEKEGAARDASKEGREAREDAEENRRKNAKNTREQGEFEHPGKYGSSSKSSPGNPNARTPSQKREDRKEWRSATQAAPDAWAALEQAEREKEKPTEPASATPALLIKLIVKETGVDYATAKKAAQRFLAHRRKAGSAGGGPNAQGGIHR